MAERLTFNLWGAGRTLRGSVGWVKAPGVRQPAGCRRDLPAADREAELGLLGRLRFHGAALFPPAGHGHGPRAAALARARRHRRARRHGHTPARKTVAGGTHLARNHHRRLHGVRDGRDGSLLGLARRRPRDVHRRLLQSRARLPPDGQLRPQREGVASAVVADPLRRRLRRGARRRSTSPAARTS